MPTPISTEDATDSDTVSCANSADAAETADYAVGMKRVLLAFLLAAGCSTTPIAPVFEFSRIDMPRDVFGRNVLIRHEHMMPAFDRHVSGRTYGMERPLVPLRPRNHLTLIRDHAPAARRVRQRVAFAATEPNHGVGRHGPLPYALNQHRNRFESFDGL
jgi:hypothetical protein